MTIQRPPPARSPSSGLPLILAGAAFVMTAYLVIDRALPGSLTADAEPRAITPRGELADFEKATIAVYEENRGSVVYITSPEVLAHLLKYASVHGRFPGRVEAGDDWLAVGQERVRVIAERDPWCRGIVVLGLGADESHLRDSFAAASRHPLVKGFAVGRTIFGEAARSWLAGEIDDEAAVRHMVSRFRALCDLWDEHRKTAETPA